MRRPIILGIVGDSAAGKTTISRGLTQILGTARWTHVCTDDCHKYDRREWAERKISALDHDCNYLDIMQLHLERPQYGQPILKPVYDHSSEQFIRPQKKDADIVVSFYPPEGVKSEDAGSHLNVRLILRPTIPHPDLSYVLDCGDGCGIRLELARDHGLPVDILGIDGNVSGEQAREMANAIWEHMSELRPEDESHFGIYNDPKGMQHSHPLALTQLLRMRSQIKFDKETHSQRLDRYPKSKVKNGQALITYHLLRKYNDLSDVLFAPPVAAMDMQKTHEAASQ
ncbi:MAG: hypothetical protein GY803_01055 [Chloroflexi bacterium]|nr:hypothetical protein [Chloroflexota bacterium]